MDTLGLLAVEVVVLLFAGTYYFGLYFVRRDVMLRREGIASFFFAFYVASCALHRHDGLMLPSAWPATIHALAAISLVPLGTALANAQHQTTRGSGTAGLVYAWTGALFIWLHHVGLRPAYLHSLLPLDVGPPHLVEDVLVGAYACLGVILVLSAVLRLAVAARRRSSLRPITAAMFVGLATAVMDLHTQLLAESPRRLLLDLGLVGIVVTSIDRSIRRIARVGDSLQTQTEALARSYAELRSTQERLVRNEQLAAVGELSAVIAHEVRNPLAIIKNALSGLRRKSLAPSDRTTLLDILDEETDRLNRLMHDLLAYARPVAPQLGPVDLDELVHRSVERAFGGVAAPRGLEVRFEIDEQAPTVDADPDLLVHAFVNIIENALQAMPQGGALTLRVRPALRNGRAVVGIDIVDTGEGMDTVVRDKAKNPFFTTRPTGTGLGLAIVERVVRNHGGQIEIRSGHGEGTTVSIYLPLDRSSLHPIPIPESSSSTLVLARGEPS